MNLIFRKMMLKDLDQILILEKQIFGRDAWPADSFIYEMSHNKNSYAYVLCSDSEIIGYAVFWFYAEELHIANIAIKTMYRGHGYGKYLMEKIFEKAEDYKVAFLEVRTSNKVAINMYRNMDFQPFIIRKKYYRDGEDALLMKKEKHQGV